MFRSCEVIGLANYRIELFSNNSNILIAEYVTATDTVTAVNTAKTLQRQINGIGGGIPTDFRVRTMQNTGAA